MGIFTDKICWKVPILNITNIRILGKGNHPYFFRGRFSKFKGFFHCFFLLYLRLLCNSNEISSSKNHDMVWPFIPGLKSAQYFNPASIRAHEILNYLKFPKMQDYPINCAKVDNKRSWSIPIQSRFSLIKGWLMNLWVKVGILVERVWTNSQVDQCCRLKRTKWETIGGRLPCLSKF